jgi:HlyD family secretion protein
MKTLLKLCLVIIALGGLLGGGFWGLRAYWEKRNRPTWRQEEVKRGRIASVINSTGTVKPVLSVRVGTVVSGPVDGVYKDFNDEVKAGDLLAQIDPTLFIAANARDEATLKTRIADFERVSVQLVLAEHDLERALKLYRQNPDFISEAELDQLTSKYQSLAAELLVAEAAVEQAAANLETSSTNLKYTQITSPVDGMIIDRKIDPGQSLAASFQTPEMFIVAPDIREKIHVYATVDENDIGLIRQAQEAGQPVHFTVDAYREDLFEGVIEEIRLSSSEVQNVVTYPVVVEAPNPELKLLPGMTATISFRIEEREDVVKVPNTALRFYPEEKRVHPKDRAILKGERWEQEDDSELEIELSAEEKAELRRNRSRRHVWVMEGQFLRAVEVVTGIEDSKYSELVTGDLKEGQKLVTGIEPKQ